MLTPLELSMADGVLTTPDTDFIQLKAVNTSRLAIKDANGVQRVLVSLEDIPDASDTTKGLVRVDGTTITATNGIITAVGGGGGGHTIQDNGVDLPQEDALNFTGAGFTASDDAANLATVIDIPQSDWTATTGASLILNKPANIVTDITAGTNITIDKTDPAKPVISSAGGGHTIQDNGTDLPQQPNLNFIGGSLSISDDAANTATIVEVAQPDWSAAAGDPAEILNKPANILTDITAGANILIDKADPSNPIISSNDATLQTSSVDFVVADWVGAAPNFTLSVSAAQIGLNDTTNLGVSLYDAASRNVLPNYRVYVDGSVDFYSATAFDGKIVFLAGLDSVSGGGHIIEWEGNPVDQRPKLNFTGAAVTGVYSDFGTDFTVVNLAPTTDNIPEGAANLYNVQADWNSTTGASQILNKPTNVVLDITAGNGIQVDNAMPSNPTISTIGTKAQWLRATATPSLPFNLSNGAVGIYNYKTAAAIPPLVISNADASGLLTDCWLWLANGGSFADATTFFDPAVYFFSGGAIPTLSVDKMDIIHLQSIDGGKKWMCNIEAQDLPIVIPENSFVVDTTTYKTVTIGNKATYTYNYSVDWGDGSPIEQVNTPAPKSHVYTSGGEHTIVIEGQCPTLSYGIYGATNTQSVLKRMYNVTMFRGTGTVQNNRFEELFRGCTLLENISEGIFDGYTSAGASAFAYAFYACSKLSKVPANLFAGITSCGTNGFFQIFRLSGITEIPDRFFANITTAGASSFSNLCAQCPELTRVGDDIWTGLTIANGASVFEAAFNKCPKLTVVGDRLCSNITSATGGSAFRYMFAETPITTAKGNWFDALRNIGTYTFDSFCRSCVNLTTVEAGLFEKITSATSYAFVGVFTGCSSLVNLPNRMFAGLTSLNVSQFDYAFSSCTSLTTLPTAMFDGITNAFSSSNTFRSTFEGCTALTTIDPNIFSRIKDVAASTGVFSRTFFNAGIVSLPPIFKYVTRVLGAGMFSDTFSNCSKLETVDPDLFAGLVTVPNDTFFNTFRICTALKTIPAALFHRLTTIGSQTFRETFAGCTALELIPSGLLAALTTLTATTNVTQLMFNSCSSPLLVIENVFGGTPPANMNVAQMFSNCSGTTAPLPEFWNLYATAGWTKANCFFGCTNAPNLADAQANGFA